MTHALASQFTGRIAEAAAPSAPSLGGFALGKLDAICAALGRRELYEEAADVVGELASGWSRWPVGSTPHWSSDITDDSSPFEYSITFGARRAPELRVLCEQQGAAKSADASWEEGLRLNERLVARYGADLSAFNLVRDLFAPMRSIPSRFSMWHSAVFGGNAPTFKVYLNPWVAGADAAPRLVDRALSQLGLDGAARDLGKHASIVYFSLDLTAGSSARVKVYAAHPGADARAIAARVPGNKQSQIARTIEALAGTSAPLRDRPVQTCHAFRPNGAPVESTVYVPVRSYVDHDGQALERACQLLRPGDAETLRDVVNAVAERPLDVGRGLITYVALRPSDGRVSVYLSPQVYSIAAPRRASLASPAEVPLRSMVHELAPRGSGSPHRATIADVQRRVAEHQQKLASHPFLDHLANHATIADMRAIAPRMAFFVMCFQDVLRLVYEHTTDPKLKAIAKTHRHEDEGHDLWYLHDLDRLGVSLEVKALFAEDRASIRDVAYTQIADTLRSTDDRCRLGVVLALEAAGAEFFGSIIAGLERLAHIDGLLYFARPHQKVEQSHGLFDDETSREMGSIQVPAPVLPEVLGVVARTFNTMSSLADDLMARRGEGSVLE